MVSAVDTPFRVLYWSGSDSPAWFTDLCSQLRYEQLTPKRLRGSIRSVLQKLQADAIIAPYERAVGKTFHAIIEALALPYRPLLVFILHDDVASAPADLLLPPFQYAIQQSVTMALSQRAAQLNLLREQETQQVSLSTISQHFEEHQRLAEELNLLKNAIVRNVSHELKTPLLQVKSAVSLMAEDSGSSTLPGYATGAVARLEAIIRNITQLADGLDIELSPITVQDSIDHAMRGLRRSWDQKPKVERVALKVENRLPPVMGDKQGLGIVLSQLLDNALKFSEDRVELIVRREGQSVIVSVRDYGIGIPKDKSDQIFESFYQIDSASTRRFGGTGVGLAIVRLILDRHLTQIEVVSEVGYGSTFSFQLPIATSQSLQSL